MYIVHTESCYFLNIFSQSSLIVLCVVCCGAFTLSFSYAIPITVKWAFSNVHRCDCFWGLPILAAFDHPPYTQVIEFNATYNSIIAKFEQRRFSSRTVIHPRDIEVWIFIEHFVLLALVIGWNKLSSYFVFKIFMRLKDVCRAFYTWNIRHFVWIASSLAAKTLFNGWESIEIEKQLNKSNKNDDLSQHVLYANGVMFCNRPIYNRIDLI